MMRIPSGVTHSNAMDVLSQGLKTLESGQHNAKTLEIDLSELQNFDSSVIAILLAWERTAQKQGLSLRCVNFPATLQNLAHVYGIESLFVH